MLKDRSLDFSFSGLKTAVLYALEDLNEKDYPDVAASFQTVIDVLLHKLNWAIEDTGIKTLVCSGGVAANTILEID